MRPVFQSYHSGLEYLFRGTILTQIFKRNVMPVTFVVMFLVFIEYVGTDILRSLLSS